MKLTTKGRFAVTAMLDLALHESLAHDAMTLEFISFPAEKRQAVSAARFAMQSR